MDVSADVVLSEIHIDLHRPCNRRGIRLVERHDLPVVAPRRADAALEVGLDVKVQRYVWREAEAPLDRACAA